MCVLNCPLPRGTTDHDPDSDEGKSKSAVEPGCLSRKGVIPDRRQEGRQTEGDGGFDLWVHAHLSSIIEQMIQPCKTLVSTEKDTDADL